MSGAEKLKIRKQFYRNTQIEGLFYLCLILRINNPKPNP
jgi:hypothetical protein